MHREPTWIVETACNPAEAMQRVRAAVAKKNPFAVVVTDLVMDNDRASGIALIKAVQEADPLAMSILYTSYPGVLKGRDLLDLGVFDVVEKAGGFIGDPADRIVTRARAALRYRDWAVRISFLRRYFDRTVYRMIEQDVSLLEARTREVTVAFWDIRGFSRLCQQLIEDADLVAGFLKQHCELAAKAIFEHDGIVDKFMGDGVMALFGAFDQTSEGQRTAAVNAAKAAVSMYRGFEESVLEWLPKWEAEATEAIQIKLACGIHSGRAIVGNLGTDFREQFTALGAHVNFAQRLESIAGKEAGTEILVSRPTARRIDHSIPVLQYRTVSDVKNIPGDHVVYRVDLGKYQVGHELSGNTLRAGGGV